MSLETLLHQNQSFFQPLLRSEDQAQKSYWMDLGPNNSDLKNIDFTNPKAFDAYTQAELKKHQAIISLGRYGETRVIYQQDGFEKERCIHLGLDIGLPAGTPLFAPISSHIHSIANHKNAGDYGPTLILKHELEGAVFYTLYGHLSWESIQHWTPGMRVQAGEQIANIGTHQENGQWPEHVHVQIIKKLASENSHPGVCSPEQWKSEQFNCPDPGIILGAYFHCC